MKLSLFLDTYIAEDFLSANTSLLEEVTFYNDSVEIADFSIALLGVPENRNALNQNIDKRTPYHIRKYFYSLNTFSKKHKLLDLGDLKKGNTIADTYVAVKEVVTGLLQKGITIVLLGGTQDISIPVADVFSSELDNELVISTIDSKINLGNTNEVNSDSIWAHVMKKDRLTKINLIAAQTYLLDKNEVSKWKGLYNNILRLGNVRESIINAEPFLRDSDFISFDISSVRYSDSGLVFDLSPNGLYAEEACQLAWYSGMSDRTKCWGLFGEYENSEKHLSFSLVAQVAWHFIDGFVQRKGDYPVADIQSYKEYHLTTEEYENELTFLESPRSGKWWMKIMIDDQISYIVACRYEDYISACNNNLPEVWYREINRLHSI